MLLMSLLSDRDTAPKPADFLATQMCFSQNTSQNVPLTVEPQTSFVCFWQLTRPNRIFQQNQHAQPFKGIFFYQCAIKTHDIEKESIKCKIIHRTQEGFFSDLVKITK